MSSSINSDNNNSQKITPRAQEFLNLGIPQEIVNSLFDFGMNHPSSSQKQILPLTLQLPYALFDYKCIVFENFYCLDIC